MSRYARCCIQLLTVVLVAFSCIAASANEQIASRYAPNLKSERLMHRAACSDSHIAGCKLTLKDCYERCAKDRDINQRAFCLKLCANESLRCYQACNR